MVIEECPDDQDDEDKQERAEKINKGVIRRDITDNEKETNWYTLNKVIEEFSDDTTPGEMEECGNDNKKQETSEKINEGVIHRDIIDNKKETKWNTLNKVIEELPGDTTPADIEECGNDDEK